MAKNKNISVVMIGHVDHGKSTVLGRLLADTDALPKGKLEQVKENCRNNSKPFEYAFLIDALKDEQSQGITIDSARVFYKTEECDYIIIDAPGHIEFLRNMVTGASRAEAAFLVIDAAEGVRENSKRHGFLASMLGIKQISVIVNKMDAVGYDEKVFVKIVDEYSAFLDKINVKPLVFVPVSGMEGDNVATKSGRMPWYGGKTVLEAMHAFQPGQAPVEAPFRLPVQDVYKFTRFGDDRRIIAGTVSTGEVAPGDEVIFYPSGKKSVVRSIETFNAPSGERAVAGQATGITLTEQVYVTRGEIAVNMAQQKPQVTSRVKTSMFWLGKKPMEKGEEYTFRLGTARVKAELETIEKCFDASDLDAGIISDTIEKNTIAECVLRLKKPVAFDLVGDFQETSRFVIVDDHQISGGGIVLEALKDEQSWVRDKVLLRDYKWIKSYIPHEARAEKYAQQSAVIFITGEKDAPRKEIAKELEAELFSEGKLVYFLGVGNILYGVDADIKGVGDAREEHLRRLAEVAHILLDAGVILIVSAIDLTQEDLELMHTAVGEDKMVSIWVGEKVTTDLNVKHRIEPPYGVVEAAEHIKKLLIEKGIIEKK